MGGISSKKKSSFKLSNSDYKFFTKQTGLKKEEITHLFDKFNQNNPDQLLNKQEFVNLYIELRPEPKEHLEEISEYIFKAFDVDKSGSINFNEFLVS